MTMVGELAYLALGANLGDAKQTLRRAMQALSELRDCELMAQSSLYRTAPIGCPPGAPDFINAVVALRTTLSPLDLLAAALRLEQQFGRVRTQQNAARLLDLDVLLYGSQTLNTLSLTVPHPRMHERAFVLRPLVEIASDVDIPGHGLASELLAGLKEQAVVVERE